MRKKGIDLVDRKFGKLTVLRECPKDKNNLRRWLCLCDCGKEKTVYQNALCSKKTRSCGCYAAEQSKKRMSKGWSSIFTKEYLIREHKEKQLSLRQIAKKHQCSLGCVTKYMKKFNIQANDPFYNLAGQKIEMLFVKDLAYTKNGCSYWNTLCDCGNEKVISGKCIVRRSSVSCGCWNKNKCWKGVGDLGKTYWSRIIKHAAERNIEFSISMEYAWELFESQKRKCALSGVEIKIDRSWTASHNKRLEVQTASLDRIDSTLGYIEGNVQWVHKTLNKMKSDLLESDFIDWCSKVALYKY
jgi:hypothetical protein